MSASDSSTPISLAMASRCRTAFVDPPDAVAAATAFRKAGLVRMSRGRLPAERTSMTSAPTSRAASRLAGSVAGIELTPSGDRPMASITMAIVLAVYCPPHAPAPGQAARSSSSRSPRSIRPAETAPTASNTSPTATRRPRNKPGMIVPPYNSTAGRFTRASAIAHPGTVLSQEAMQTIASK